jgi:hypothetical protein
MILDDRLRQLYARAKEEQLQILADEIQQIADEPQPGEVVTLKGDEREVKIADMLEHRRLRIESQEVWRQDRARRRRESTSGCAAHRQAGRVDMCSLLLQCAHGEHKARIRPTAFRNG